MRNSVGAGEIKGARERWIAPAALYTAGAGISESSWTITPETVIALRLHGATVEDHNRRVIRTSGPGRDFALQPRGTSTRYLAYRSIKFGQVFLPDALLDRASDMENLPALSGRLRDDLSFVPEKTLQTPDIRLSAPRVRPAHSRDFARDGRPCASLGRLADAVASIAVPRRGASVGRPVGAPFAPGLRLHDRPSRGRHSPGRPGRTDRPHLPSISLARSSNRRDCRRINI